MKSLIVVLLMLSNLCYFAKAAESSREVLLDNASVEVIRLTYPPGTESGMHTHVHPHRVVYVVTGGKLEMIPADKNKPSQVVKAKTGSTMFVPANTHNVKNIGTTEVVLIETELKKP